jgi:hypothetical protein
LDLHCLLDSPKSSHRASSAPRRSLGIRCGELERNNSLVHHSCHRLCMLRSFLSIDFWCWLTQLQK